MSFLVRFGNLNAAVIGLVWVCLTSVPVHGQSASHRVRLSPPRNVAEDAWYPGPVTTVDGEIETFDEKQIAILVQGETVATRYAAERVIEISSRRLPAKEKEAIEAFESGDYTAAVKGLIEAVSDNQGGSRPPVWRQQWLSMLAAQAAWRSGRGEIALEIVAQLDERPMPPLIWNLLPVDWISSGTRGDSLAAAVKRARSESLAVKLVAANWLLAGEEYRSAAEAAIRKLAAQDDRPRIAALARQITWQSKTPVEWRNGWKDWRSEIDSLPMSLRTGPMLSLAARLEKAGLADPARRLNLILETAPPSWHPDLP